MSSWLQRQRKGTLQELATAAGITQKTDDLKKDDILAILQPHLREHKATLASNALLKEYYDRLEAIEASPWRGRAVSSANDAAASDNSSPKPQRSARKRAPKVKEEFDSLDEAVTPIAAAPVANAIVARTPAVQRSAARIPLPPSPAVVTDAIERQTAIIKENVERYWTNVGVNELVEGIRESLSSVVAVQVLALLVEGTGLRRETLHLRYAFSTPALPALNVPSYPVNLPDFFELLTSGFWAPTLLWSLTSFTIPLLFAYFFNLTLKKNSHGGIKSSSKSYRVDPLAYNVVKALVTYLVFAKGIRFGGLVSDQTVATVDRGLFGGYQSVLIGSGICTLASLYEAALRK